MGKIRASKFYIDFTLQLHIYIEYRGNKTLDSYSLNVQLVWNELTVFGSLGLQYLSWYLRKNYETEFLKYIHDKQNNKM